MESEESTRFTDSLGQGPTAAALDASKDLSIPSDLEEPINLSVKKPALVPAVNTSVALQQHRSPRGKTQQPALHADHTLEQADSAPQVKRRSAEPSETEETVSFSQANLTSLSRTDLLMPVLFPSLWPGINILVKLPRQKFGDLGYRKGDTGRALPQKGWAWHNILGTRPRLTWLADLLYLFMFECVQDI